ncbi:MAG: TlpA family protein disulfide reductase [Aquificae bacterium]|nr:TlpA family protein disulfide reductase [Aquificota bacterium]
MALNVGNLAPEFSLPVCGGESGGSEDYKLVVFYKVTCPTCKLTLPFVEKLFKSYGERIEFVGVSQDNCSDTLRFSEEYGLTFLQVSDAPDYEVSVKFDIQVVPTVYLVNPEGKIEFVEEGFVKDSMERLNSLMSKITGLPENPLFEDVSVPAFKAG